MKDERHTDAFSFARERPRAEARYWRSPEELAGSEEFLQFLRSEFPEEAPSWADPVSRRELLKLMGASLALAGFTACSPQGAGRPDWPPPPMRKVVPYVRAPEEVTPGKPLFFATSMVLGGFAKGLLVKSHTGRPIKVEGNPEHPASLGATDAFGQASILTLYDPNRSQVVTREGRISTWPAFAAALGGVRDEQRNKRGAGLRLLTETITSPSLAGLIRLVLAEFPAAKWHQYEPVSRDNARAGALLAFGEDVNPVYRVAQADVILSLDADFLGEGPGSIRYAHDFAARRRVSGGRASLNRLYAIEPSPSITGSMADHRVRARGSEVEGLARELARRLGIAAAAAEAGANTAFLDALARDLERHRGSSLVIAGAQQPPAVHALAHAMNHTLGNEGQTVVYTDSVEANPVNQTESLRELVADMQAGRVDALIILGGNPVFYAPSDLGFAAALSKVRFKAQLSLYDDETTALCNWHIPEAHFLESWGDARAYDGTVSMIQPLIAPLYQGKSAYEVLAALLGQPAAVTHDLVHDYWKAQRRSVSFEDDWQKALHDGLIAGTAFPPKRVNLKAGWSDQISALPRASGLEIVFRPDPTIWDGRFSENGWLQELPKPMSKLTWQNAAMMSPATAARLGLGSSEVADLRFRGATVRAPIWVMPGHADDSVTVHLGYGRRSGRPESDAGFNAYALRHSDQPWFGYGVEIAKTGLRSDLVSTQNHFSMEGRHLIRSATAAEYEKNPRFAQEVEERPKPDFSLYPGYEYTGYSWGMVIDLNACTGCGACVVACQAENNIPVVGREQVRRGREMHWIRVDRYYEGDPNDPAIHHQPVPCMHCENAPCELVCPVGATVHSDEGLNQMVYNRCVGTRYCSNNCPYKVRRFNFLQFADWVTPSLKPMRNPDVTVRSRGVMEKCTYCVQRISAAKIQAEEEDRVVRDGEIVPACAQACPAQAIIFGNINDPASQAARWKAEPRNYGILEDLNTRPRTTYLAEVRNPNPEITGEKHGGI